MQVIFIRHAQPEHFCLHDKDRRLTSFGETQALSIATQVLSDYTPDLFIVSPYLRAQQTLSAFTNLATKVPVRESDNITPLNDVKGALNSLQEIIDEQKQECEINCVIVICHMPIVAYMVSELTADNPISYSLAEARVIECEHIAPYLGSQIAQYIPEQA